jgi:hypothetical protein
LFLGVPNVGFEHLSGTIESYPGQLPLVVTQGCIGVRDPFRMVAAGAVIILDDDIPLIEIGQFYLTGVLKYDFKGVGGR